MFILILRDNLFFCKICLKHVHLCYFVEFDAVFPVASIMFVSNLFPPVDMDNSFFQTLMTRFRRDGALWNRDVTRNKVMTEVHWWCRGKPHPLTMEQNTEMWQLAKELLWGPKVGEDGALLRIRQRQAQPHIRKQKR